MAKVRSARGVSVNFDELKIKQQLVETPTPVEVKARQDYVDQRLKRRAKRHAQKALDENQQPEATNDEQVQPSPATEEPVMDEFEQSNEQEDLPEGMVDADSDRKQRKPK